MVASGGTAVELDLSVVIPVFNERENIAPLLEAIHRALGGGPVSYEVVIVDDGSTDGTLEELRAAQKVDPTLQVGHLRRNHGQTHALAAGFRLARGKAVVTMDGDLQNDPADIPRLLDHLNRWDVVCGVRQRRQDTWFRLLSSKIGNGFRNWVTGDTIVDTGCTLKAYRRECVAKLELYRGLHRFLPTLLKMRGWRVTEVGVSHLPRIHGETKYNARNRIWNGLGDTLVVRWMMRNRIAFASILDVFENPQRDKETSSAANDVENAEKAPILKS